MEAKMMVLSILVSVLPLVLFLVWQFSRRQLLPWPLTLIFLVSGVAAAPLTAYLGLFFDPYLPHFDLKQVGGVLMVPDAKALWLHALISVGPLEEFTKFLPVLIYLILGKTDRRVVFFGMVLSAIGFATAESVYGATGGTVMSSLGIAVARAFMSAPTHMGLGALGGWVLLRNLQYQRSWPVSLLLILVIPGFWHGMTDGFLLGQMNFRAFGFLAMLMTVIGGLVFIRKTAKRLREEENRLNGS
jgi:RsiW-degrading membrane proteinase PrsW (M82 family)